jgi:cysteine desulfurase/selenocysteine lyase
VHGKPLAYLDNAATCQKPSAVIECESRYYETLNANIHRGVHELSQRATDAYEAARGKTRQFLNARSDKEIVFTRGTTESINLVAESYGRANLRAGDEVIVSTMEHHSNIVPWQMICERTGAVLRVIPITDAGELDLEAYQRLLGVRTKIVAIAHVSNVLGTINPVREMISQAHAAGAVVLVDGAQSAPHLAVDMQALDCDFFALSSHKLYGPTGIGVLYGKQALLEAMPPYQGGGSMISRVSFAKTTYAPVPQKFEAGTPHIAGTIAFGAALDYLNAVGLDAIAAHEDGLLEYATQQAQAVPGLRIIGTARAKAGVFSFVVDGIHAHDLGTILDHEGVAIRAGHHCAMPLMERYGVAATARASFAAYNTREEVDALFNGIERARKLFGRAS